jgi:hypothetical protein
MRLQDMKTALFLLLLGCLAPWPAAAQTADPAYGVASHAGIIDAVDIATASMIVSGYHYDVAVDAQVEIGGSYGAFTMLRPGMRIRFDYLVISPSERRIIMVQELPDGVLVEEA